MQFFEDPVSDPAFFLNHKVDQDADPVGERNADLAITVGSTYLPCTVPSVRYLGTCTENKVPYLVPVRYLSNCIFLLRTNY